MIANFKYSQETGILSIVLPDCGFTAFLDNATSFIYNNYNFSLYKYDKAGTYTSLYIEGGNDPLGRDLGKAGFLFMTKIFDKIKDDKTIGSIEGRIDLSKRYYSISKKTASMNYMLRYREADFNKLDVIKKIRTLYVGLGLKEAKDFADRLSQGIGMRDLISLVPPLGSYTTSALLSLFKQLDPKTEVLPL